MQSVIWLYDTVRHQCRPMFSKPLAYPSALDRRAQLYRLRVRRPSWRGGGARRSCAHAQRDLSLSGGASIRN
jgi:hypothetical protein